MGKVLLADTTGTNFSYLTKSILVSPAGSSFAIQMRVALSAAQFAAITGNFTGDFFDIGDIATAYDGIFASRTGSPNPYHFGAEFGSTPSAAVLSADTWMTIRYEATFSSGTTWNVVAKVNGTTFDSYSVDLGFGSGGALGPLRVGSIFGSSLTGVGQYVDDVQVEAPIGTPVFTEDFESGTFAAWDSTTGGVSIVTDPFTSAGFSLAAVPSSLTIPRSESATSTITSTLLSGPDDTADLTYTADDPGITATFAPGTIDEDGGTAIATVFVDGAVVDGSYTLTVHGTDGDETIDVPITITVIGQGESCEDAVTLPSPCGVTDDQDNTGVAESGANPLVDVGYFSTPNNTLWWKWTNTLGRDVDFLAYVIRPLAGSYPASMIAGVFPGACGAWDEDAETFDGQSRLVAVIPEATADPELTLNYVDCVVHPGDTVYVVVASTDGVTPAPNFRMNWECRQKLDRDDREATAELAVQTPASGHTQWPLDYVEMGGDDYVLYWDSDDGSGDVFLNVAKWDGAARTVLGWDSQPVGISGAGDTAGSWSGAQIASDGDTLYVAVLQLDTVTDPYGSLYGDPSATWTPNRVRVYSSDGTAAFALIGTIDAATFNADADENLSTTYPLDLTADPSQPGRCYVVWSERGFEGGVYDYFPLSSNDQYERDRTVIGCFGASAPFSFFDVHLDRKIVWFGDGSPGPYQTDPYPFDSPNGQTLGCKYVVNDEATPQLLYIPLQDVTSGAPYRQNTTQLQTLTINDAGSVTLAGTLSYTQPPAGAPNEAGSALWPAAGAETDTASLLLPVAVEPLSHIDPADGKRIRYIVLTWLIDNALPTEAIWSFVMRIGAGSDSAISADYADNGSLASTAWLSPAAPGAFHLFETFDTAGVGKKISTDRFNQTFVQGYFHSRRGCIGWQTYLSTASPPAGTFAWDTKHLAAPSDVWYSYKWSWHEPSDVIRWAINKVPRPLVDPRQALEAIGELTLCRLCLFCAIGDLICSAFSTPVFRLRFKAADLQGGSPASLAGTTPVFGHGISGFRASPTASGTGESTATAVFDGTPAYKAAG